MRLALPAALLACCACLAPPAVLPAERRDLAAALRTFPADSEIVELVAEDGCLLRGVFVPAEPGAPICVHLPGATDTVAASRYSQRDLLRELCDIGVASLMLDYRGVGVSDGARHVDHLGGDALALWNEALRRAGGDPQRVALRATSIGTVAAAELLALGLRPAGIVLIAPILPDSVVARYASVEHGWYGPLLARLLFRDVSDVDVIGQLRAAAVPVLARASDADRFLDAAERAALRACVEQLPRSRWASESGGHYFSALQGRGVPPAEVAFWRTTIGTRVDAAQRVAAWRAKLSDEAWERIQATPGALERFRELACCKRVGDPALVAAAALEFESAELARRFLWAFEIGAVPSRWPQGARVEEWQRILSSADPAGAMSAAWWVDVLERLAGTRRGFGFSIEPSVESIARLVDGWRPGTPLLFRYSYEAGGERGSVAIDLGALGEELFARLRPIDARRQLLRAYLRASEIPSRLASASDGTPLVEAWIGRRWTAVPLADAAGKSVSDAGPYARTSWNALHRALFSRVDAQGREHGLDSLDPLLWPSSTYLVREPRLGQALAALDAFAAGGTREREEPPLARALLQRDLSSIRAWVVAHGEDRPADADTAACRALGERLAHAIALVALTRAEIDALPSAAPVGLFERDGPWVELGDVDGARSLTPAHDAHAAGRSAFSVHLSMPGGRAETLAYLERLRAFDAPLVQRMLNPATPQFPPGTSVALARRARLVSDAGELVRSPLVESVQLRTFIRFGDAQPRAGEVLTEDQAPLQRVAELELDRRALLRDPESPLRAVAADETAYPLFGTHGGDPLENEHGAPPRRLDGCIQCHGAPGIFSLASYTGMATGPGTHFLLELPRAPARFEAAAPTASAGR